MDVIMCLEFFVKYLLFIVNLTISLIGLGIIGIGIAVLIALSGLNEIIPINVVPISMIVLGSIVFVIGFLACCGAVRESQCMLFSYALIVSVLAGLKIWLTVVIFRTLSSIQTTVDGWLVSAFNSTAVNPAYHVLELSFRCCGTTGPDSYTTEYLPPSCCGQNIDFRDTENITSTECQTADAFQGCSDVVAGWFDSFGGAVGWVLIVVIVIENINFRDTENITITECQTADAFQGCSDVVAGWFDSFGGAVGWVLIVVIVIECVAILFSLFFCNTVRRNKRKMYY